METKVDVLAVWDEAIRHAELTMPTPLARHGESFEHPVHHAGRLRDMKQARAAVAALVELLRDYHRWNPTNCERDCSLYERGADLLARITPAAQESEP